MAQLLFLLCKIQFLAVFAVLHNGLLLMLSFSRTNLGNWSFRHQLHCSMLLLWIIFYIFFQIRNVTCNYVRLNEIRPISVKKVDKEWVPSIQHNAKCYNNVTNKFMFNYNNEQCMHFSLIFKIFLIIWNTGVYKNSHNFGIHKPNQVLRKLKY